MDIENKIEVWANQGAEPDDIRKEKGFEGGYYPPAGLFNWLFHCNSAAIVELQNLLEAISAGDVGALPIEGGELTGELTVNENFQVRKTYDGVPYRSYIKPVNYSVAMNGDYSTGIIHYKNGVNQAQLTFNKDGIILRDNVNAKAYQIFGQHNVDLLKTLFLSLNGGVLAGNLDFKKVENGSATIYKNHSSTADFGLIIRDVAANGNYNQLLLCAEDNTLKYRDTAGNIGVIPRIKTGSYTGNGLTGLDNACVLNIGFRPFFVLIFDGTASYELPVCNFTSSYKNYAYLASGSSSKENYAKFSNNAVCWYSTSSFAGDQINVSEHVYNYMAIG